MAEYKLKTNVCDTVSLTVESGMPSELTSFWSPLTSQSDAWEVNIRVCVPKSDFYQGRSVHFNPQHCGHTKAKPKQYFQHVDVEKEMVSRSGHLQERIVA